MFRFFPSIAIIGPDGSGKTTVTRLLIERTSIPFHYLYMGVSWTSSNVLLPTTRLVQYLRQRKNPGKVKEVVPEPLPGDEVSSKKSLIASWLSLANKLAEEWYRQLLSYYYQFRGKVLLYDRHFVFDFSLKPMSSDTRSSDRFHRFIIQRFFPEPGLVICLDAPEELLFERKQEFTQERLRWLREGYLGLAKSLPNIHYVDASQPLETVYQEVLAIIEEFLEKEKLDIDRCKETKQPRATGF